MTRVLILLLLFLSIPDSFCLAQAKLKAGPTGLIGLVVDAKTNQPIPNVSVMLVGGDRGTKTDAIGAFVFDKLSLGKHTLHVSHISYQSKTRKNT